MKSRVFLFCVSIFLFQSESFAHTPENEAIEDAHSGPERNFSSLSEAVVEVRTPYGYGTGTLFSHDNRQYVLTASHVLRNFENDDLLIGIHYGGEEQTATIAYRNNEKDVAILLTSEMDSRTPVRLKFRNRRISVGERAGYCGFPNRRDLACFSGMVSLSNSNLVNLHSYAWKGASGSLVIDKRGRIVGILSAIEVGNFLGIPSLIEDLVWIKPLSSEILDNI